MNTSIYVNENRVCPFKTMNIGKHKEGQFAHKAKEKGVNVRQAKFSSLSRHCGDIQSFFASDWNVGDLAP